jgi:hypothetical protein
VERRAAPGGRFRLTVAREVVVRPTAPVVMQVDGELLGPVAEAEVTLDPVSLLVRRPRSD